MKNKLQHIYIDEFIEEMSIEEDTAKDLYFVFIEEMIEECEKLLSGMNNKDIDKIKKSVHNIKGVSGSFKAVKVFELSSIINEQFKSNYNIVIEAIINELIKEIRNVSAEVKIYFRSYI